LSAPLKGIKSETRQIEFNMKVHNHMMDIAERSLYEIMTAEVREVARTRAAKVTLEGFTDMAPGNGCIVPEAMRSKHPDIIHVYGTSRMVLYPPSVL
jgi:hypothetical protein